MAAHLRHSQLDSVDVITVDMDRVEPDPELELDKLWTHDCEWKNIFEMPLPALSSLWLEPFYDLNLINMPVLHQMLD